MLCHSLLTVYSEVTTGPLHSLITTSLIIIIQLAPIVWYLTLKKWPKSLLFFPIGNTALRTLFYQKFLNFMNREIQDGPPGRVIWWFPIQKRELSHLAPYTADYTGCPTHPEIVKAHAEGNLFVIQSYLHQACSSIGMHL